MHNRFWSQEQSEYHFLKVSSQSRPYFLLGLDYNIAILLPPEKDIKNNKYMVL